MELKDLTAFERLTGLAFFTPTAAAAGIHLGNIEMMRCDYALQSFDILRSRRGVVYPRKRHFYGRAPVFTLTLNQFPSSTQFLHLAATRQADTSRNAAANQTFIFTAILGGAFDIGQETVWVSSVKVGTTTMIDGIDYFLDQFNGWIWLPETGGRIAAGENVVVTYSYSSQDLETYTATDNPSTEGLLTVFAEDEYGPPAREKWEMRVELSVAGMPDTDPAKFRSATLEALVYGVPTVYKRPNPYTYSELLTGAGGIIDLG
jgi:hypothetical protein